MTCPLRSTGITRFVATTRQCAPLRRIGTFGLAVGAACALTTAACGGLRSTPDSRPRRVLLHLSYSYAPPFGPAMLVLHDPQRKWTRASAIRLFRFSPQSLHSRASISAVGRVTRASP